MYVCIFNNMILYFIIITKQREAKAGTVFSFTVALASSQYSFQRAPASKAGHQPQDISISPQVKSSIHEINWTKMYDN